MKKKSISKSTKTQKVKVSRSRIKTRSTRSSSLPSISYQRIIIFSACVVISLVAVVSVTKGHFNQAVAGISIARGFFAQGAIALPPVEGATSYNIYYKQSSESTFSNTVIGIPETVRSYTVSYLKKGTTYEYKVSALDATGKEFWWSPTRSMSGIQSM